MLLSIIVNQMKSKSFFLDDKVIREWSRVMTLDTKKFYTGVAPFQYSKVANKSLAVPVLS